MPNADSEPASQRLSEAGKDPQARPAYRFAFSEEGPYGAAARLLRAHAPQGLVLDIGCGYGAIGEHLAHLGREYIGIDQDATAVEDLRRRGLEAHCLDLQSTNDTTQLAGQIMAILQDRPLGAILLLDVIEHLTRPEVVLELASALATQGQENSPTGPVPVLITSIPNVAHVDLGSKLLAGRWDVTSSGLLDATHVQFFTKSRILSLFGSRGYEPIAEEDVILHHSDQHFPEDHPFVGPTVLRAHLDHLRSLSDENGMVNQFVQAWRIPTRLRGAPPDRSRTSPPTESYANHADQIPGADWTQPAENSPEAPFLSVLVRTTGRRNSMLAEALTCLAAQTLDSLEVLVLLHFPDEPPGDLPVRVTKSTTEDSTAPLGKEGPSSSRPSRSEREKAIRDLIARFPDDFRCRVHLHTTTRQGRSSPLNDGVELSKGRYIAFLDDDDLVTADWAEAFFEGATRAPGTIVRSQTRARNIEAARGAQGDDPMPVTRSPLREDFAARFDFLDHLATNHTPINSLAIPASVFRDLHLRFDETLERCEDWDLLMRASELTGVSESGKPTAIYQRWISPAHTNGQLDPAWPSAHKRILEKLSETPLLLPAGTAKRLGVVMADPRQLELKELEREHLERALAEARDTIQRLDASLQHATRAALTLRAQLEAKQRDLSDLRNSTSWRLTAPLRALHGLLRSLR